MTLSVSEPLPPALLALVEDEFDGALLHDPDARVTIETDAAFAARVRSELPERIRLIGSDGVIAGSGRAGSEVARELLHAIDGDPGVAIWSGPVTTAGRVELLPFLREQAVSITAHRYGNPYPPLAELEV